MLKFTTLFALISLPFSSPKLAANDILTLKNKDHITGQVTALEQGLIHLQSPLSADPLLFKNEQMNSILFQLDPADIPNQHGSFVLLRNGDQFSGDLRQLDDSKVILDTWYAGSLNIPRHDIASLYLGVNPQKLLFQGPTGLAGWEEINGWDFEENELISTGLGLISRKVDFPDQYIVTITLGWQNTPSCVIHVGGSHANPREKSDEYLITYNNSGLDFKRHAPHEERNYLAIENLQSPPAQLENNEATIELRINRVTHEILLYLNEKKIGRYLDPLKETPMGSYLSIESRSSERKGNVIKNIQIRKWDAVTERLQRESPPEDKTLDALTTNEGERYSGKILAFDSENQNFLVQSPLSKQAITIPASKAAVLHFKKENPDLSDKKSAQNPPFQLELGSDGQLTLYSLSLKNDTLEADHPILGTIQIDRKILQKISHQGQKSPSPQP